MQKHSSPSAPLITALMLSVLVLEGCVPLVVGAGAGTVVGAAAEERGVSGVWSDTKIKTQINYRWMKHNKEMFHALDLTVREGRVLVAGNVSTHQQHLDAIRLIWEVEGVKEVVDKVTVSGAKGGLGDYTRDAWITTQLKTRMLLEKDIASRNYNIKTVGAVVYIMGVAKNDTELRRVTFLASRIANVQRVVCSVRLRGQPLPSGTGPSGTEGRPTSSSGDNAESLNAF